MKIAIIMPSYNEGASLTQTLNLLLDKCKTDSFLSSNEIFVVIVDDGSKEPINSGDFSAKNVFVLRHLINLGQGASLQTGMVFARDRLKSDYFFHFDSDGQHSVDDIPAFLKGILEKKVDIIFGNRFSSETKTNVPLARKLLLKTAILFESLVTGVRLSDAHNGFRVFNRNCANVLNLKQSRMAHATEIKMLVHRYHLRYSELPNTVTYSSETLKKGQSNLNSIQILSDLIKVYIFDRI